jgi:hypothetical protein
MRIKSVSLFPAAIGIVAADLTRLQKAKTEIENLRADTSAVSG